MRLGRYRGLDDHDLIVTAYTGSADDRRGRRAVSFLARDVNVYANAEQLDVRRLCGRLELWRNALDTEEAKHTLPYAWRQGDNPVDVTFDAEDERVRFEFPTAGHAVTLARAQAEDLHDVLEARLAGEHEPRDDDVVIAPDGELVP